MNYVIKEHQPKRVFEIFEELCAIPHGSGNEKGIADYIEAFAGGLGLPVLRDETGNVFVRKSAAAGYEGKEAILLQGHMDMVCEKNADSNHDFVRDGLKLSVKDGFLWADGTTLGADDGIAVAMMLALLETDKHPTLECLFTVEEETGLAGAKGFDCSVITAKKMVNLDSEEDNQVTAGCAGGCRTEVDFDYSPRLAPLDYKVIKIALTGLSGGHSGAEIHCGKTNAVVAMGRLLGALHDDVKFNLIDISCDGKDNAIARECFATLATQRAGDLKNKMFREFAELKKELADCDRGISVDITVTDTDSPIQCIDEKTTDNIIAFLATVKTGVLKMSNQIEGLVEYSRNLGVAETCENRVKFTLSSRSSLESQLDLSCRELDTLSSLVGAVCRHYARYPGWEYSPVSPLRDKYISSFKQLYGKDLTVGVIHAGLECGILASKTSGMDIISVGPDMYDIHSPNEHLSLASVNRVWNVLLDVVRG